MNKQNHILIHITYFEHRVNIEQACRITKELGADGIEFRSPSFSKEYSHLEYLDEISRAVDRYPLKEVSFGAPGVDLMQADERGRHQQIVSAMQFYQEAARRFPVNVINGRTGRLQNSNPKISLLNYEEHGSVLATERQWQQAVEGYKQLGQLALEKNFRIAFETHGLFLHDTMDATMRLVKEIDLASVGVLWDHVNLMLFPISPSLGEAIKLAGSRIYAVHLKNVLVPPRQFLSICDLGQGIVDVREQVQLLQKSGFGGPLCIECPRPGDRLHFAIKDMSYLKALLGGSEP